jgi:hypothetical protein
VYLRLFFFPLTSFQVLQARVMFRRAVGEA